MLSSLFPLQVSQTLWLATGEGSGNPLQYSCLENPMDGGAWWATGHGVTKESDTTNTWIASSSFQRFNSTLTLLFANSITFTVCSRSKHLPSLLLPLRSKLSLPLSWILELALLLISLFLPHLPAPARRVNSPLGSHLFNKYVSIGHLLWLTCEIPSSVCSVSPESMPKP